MLKGETITDGWKSEEVKEALDLCLSCKGCKSECPTNVDMATYKAEFLSHYYEGRLRPRHAYAFGLIEHWARLGSKVAGLANFFTQTPGFCHAAKFLAGMTQERKIPAFAKQTFLEWFRKHGSMGPRQGHSGVTAKESSSPAVSGGGSMPVLLWPDTFTNYFDPQIGQAAVEVLERFGFQVIVPDTKICCGRPLYDYGFLKQAKRRLQAILKLLQPQLKPACRSSFWSPAAPPCSGMNS